MLVAFSPQAEADPEEIGGSIDELREQCDRIAGMPTAFTCRERRGVEGIWDAARLHGQAFDKGNRSV